LVYGAGRTCLPQGITFTFVLIDSILAVAASHRPIEVLGLSMKTGDKLAAGMPNE